MSKAGDISPSPTAKKTPKARRMSMRRSSMMKAVMTAVEVCGTNVTERQDSAASEAMSVSLGVTVPSEVEVEVEVDEVQDGAGIGARDDDDDE